jgi:hypothetical protein
MAPRFVLLLVLLAGCPQRYDRKYEAPTVDEVLAQLAEEREALASYKSLGSKMDYWAGSNRMRGDVLVMGKRGAYVRMQALRPDDATAADLACDGMSFVYIDRLNNCQLTGPCTAESIASLLRVPLAPDDFLYLALGATPVIDGAQGTIEWNRKSGREVIKLEGAGGMKQTIELDGRDGQKTWDVMKSEVRGPDDKVIWTVEHKGYTILKDEAGASIRVPGKSNIRTPQDKSDLLVEWGDERQVNLELGDELFFLEPEPVPTCGQKP